MKNQILTGVIIGGLIAQSASAGFGITAKAGTLGFGADLTVNLASRFNARAGINSSAGYYKTSMNMDEADVDGELDLRTVPILLDFHPMESNFRISLGAVVNDSEIVISADPTEPIELENTDYDIGNLDGKIKFQRLSYYVGIGCGNAAGRDGRWHFACDFGAIYHGKPEVTASARASNPAIQSALNDALETERGEFEDDISVFQWYPVISAGVSFAV